MKCKLFHVYAVLAIASLLVSGCAPPPRFTGDEFVLNLPAAEEQHSDSLSQLHPGDEVEIIYRFNQTQEAEYKLARGDRVAFHFIASPELDIEQEIRPDGRISLPYIGDFIAAGKTVRQLNRAAAAALGRHLVKPELYVLVTEHSSRTRELKDALRTNARGLSRVLLVRADGVLTFPIIGDVSTAGLGMDQLVQLVRERYKDQVPGLEVDVLLARYSEKNIYVFGEVVEPGAFPVNAPVNLFQALALSGGLRAGAASEYALAVRVEGTRVVARRVDLAATLSGRRSSGHAPFVLQPEDILYVPRGRLANAADMGRMISEALMYRGIGITFGYDIDDR